MSSFMSYFVEGLEVKDISRDFLRTILIYSDSFSLLYFRYKENEPLKQSVKDVKKALAPFHINTRSVTEWPGTKLLGEQRHIYKLSTYKACMDVLPVFDMVDTLWDWAYPDYPMDLACYKNGFAWFYSITHEHFAMLNLRRDRSYPLASDLESLGVSLIPKGTKSEAEMYYDPKSIVK